jgi:hypothetical protein
MSRLGVFGSLLKLAATPEELALANATGGMRPDTRGIGDLGYDPEARPVFSVDSPYSFLNPAPEIPVNPYAAEDEIRAERKRLDEQRRERLSGVGAEAYFRRHGRPPISDEAEAGLRLPFKLPRPAPITTGDLESGRYLGAPDPKLAPPPGAAMSGIRYDPTRNVAVGSDGTVYFHKGLDGRPDTDRALREIDDRHARETRTRGRAYADYNRRESMERLNIGLSKNERRENEEMGNGRAALAQLDDEIAREKDSEALKGLRARRSALQRFELWSPKRVDMRRLEEEGLNLPQGAPGSDGSEEFGQQLPGYAARTSPAAPVDLTHQMLSGAKGVGGNLTAEQLSEAGKPLLQRAMPGFQPSKSERAGIDKRLADSAATYQSTEPGGLDRVRGALAYAGGKLGEQAAVLGARAADASDWPRAGDGGREPGFDPGAAIAKGDDAPAPPAQPKGPYQRNWALKALDMAGYTNSQADLGEALNAQRQSLELDTATRARNAARQRWERSRAPVKAEPAAPEERVPAPATPDSHTQSSNGDF